jgi:hypothetical protein
MKSPYVKALTCQGRTDGHVLYGLSRGRRCGRARTGAGAAPGGFKEAPARRAESVLLLALLARELQLDTW